MGLPPVKLFLFEFISIHYISIMHQGKTSLYVIHRNGLSILDAASAGCGIPDMPHPDIAVQIA